MLVGTLYHACQLKLLSIGTQLPAWLHPYGLHSRLVPDAPNAGQSQLCCSSTALSAQRGRMASIAQVLLDHYKTRPALTAVPKHCGLLQKPVSAYTYEH